ncbi:hypothetical protein F4803DRAFT_553378 [Xylaria telfairii]|nr:hypothetical protein F4803DRAFT_553378 [Xylaria telfairii]
MALRLGVGVMRSIGGESVADSGATVSTSERMDEEEVLRQDARRKMQDARGATEDTTIARDGVLWELIHGWEYEDMNMDMLRVLGAETLGRSWTMSSRLWFVLELLLILIGEFRNRADKFASWRSSGTLGSFAPNGVARLRAVNRRLAGDVRGSTSWSCSDGDRPVRAFRRASAFDGKYPVGHGAPLLLFCREEGPGTGKPMRQWRLESVRVL